jgi:hypothetical protein
MTRSRLLALLSLGALLAVAAIAVLLWPRARPEATAPRFPATLIGVVGGRFHGKAFMSRRAAPGEQLKPGEVLLVRFRVQAPAAVHLRLQGPKASRGLWADGRPDTEPPPALVPAGEHALLADRQVLAVRTEEYGTPLRVTLVASFVPFTAEQQQRLRTGPLDEAGLAKTCPACAREVLEVSPPPEGASPEPGFEWAPTGSTAP